MTPPISKLIAQLAAKLPRTQVVRYDTTHISGAELLLTPLKEINNQPIHPHQTYTIAVPVVRLIGHRGRLRNAWLAHGIQGIYNYLLPYYGHQKATAFKKKFMHSLENPKN